MSDAGASIPDLKKRGKVLYVFLGLGAVAAVAVVIVIALGGGKSVDDPGPAACKHFEQQAEMGPAPWDELVENLAWSVENLKTTSGEPIKIHSQRRDDKCTESLRKLQKNIDDDMYRAIVKCFADATRAEQGYICLGPLLERRARS